MLRKIPQRAYEKPQRLNGPPDDPAAPACNLPVSRPARPLLLSPRSVDIEKDFSMDQPARLAPSVRSRVALAVIGLALLAAGIAADGLGGLLLVMASLVPIGAAVANVTLVAGLIETVRHWHHQS